MIREKIFIIVFKIIQKELKVVQPHNWKPSENVDIFSFFICDYQDSLLCPCKYYCLQNDSYGITIKAAMVR